MSESAQLHRMSVTGFLDWQEGQESRYELVDGIPVAMAGARQRHDRIVVNAIGELRSQLRGKPCRPFTGGTAVLVPAGNIRRPDAGVLEVVVWLREGGLWRSQVLTDPAAVITLPGLGVCLALADLYEGLVFQPCPTIVVRGPE